MRKPSITVITNNHLIQLLLSICLLINVNVAMANKDDFKLPIEIDSDKQQIDLKESTTIFDTNVSVTQGSLAINADYMKVSGQDKKGHEVYIATGSPATYRQTLDDGKPIIAQANSIRYDVATRSLVLKGDAQLRQNDSVVKSAIIRYDLTLQTLQAEGLDGKPVRSVFNTAQDDNEQDKP
jgi:lipopolysaccharide export system protein LptA